MTYQTIFSRSFSRHDQKKLGCGAFLGCLIIALSFCSVFKPNASPLPVLYFRLPMGFGLKMLLTEEIRNQPEKEIKAKEITPICDTSDPMSDVCELNGDIRIHGNSSTIFLASTQIGFVGGKSSWTISPYARKGDKTAMGSVKKLTIKMTPLSSQAMPNCNRNHSVPAIVFSTGGYAGNHFHDFSDLLVPLYITSREFNGEVQFIITNKKSWWIGKYKNMLQSLSRHEILDIDKEDIIHCFSKMIVGLRHHKELSIDPSKSPYSMKEFRHFLRSSYSLKRPTSITLREGDRGGKRPRLLIISRRRTRSFMNEGQIVEMGRRLGFEVVVAEARANLSRFAELVNSCDAMMGVHGAGLTNMVFLPENAVFIQVIPLGRMEWIARTCFGKPAKDMNLRYLEYKISEEESSLIHKYPLDHEVFRDPYVIQSQGWSVFRSVYMDKQNVKLDVARFRATLSEALQLLRL